MVIVKVEVGWDVGGNLGSKAEFPCHIQFHFPFFFSSLPSLAFFPCSYVCLVSCRCTGSVSYNLSDWLWVRDSGLKTLFVPYRRRVAFSTPLHRVRDGR